MHSHLQFPTANRSPKQFTHASVNSTFIPTYIGYQSLFLFSKSHSIYIFALFTPEIHPSITFLNLNANYLTFLILTPNISSFHPYFYPFYLKKAYHHTTQATNNTNNQSYTTNIITITSTNTPLFPIYYRLISLQLCSIVVFLFRFANFEI